MSKTMSLEGGLNMYAGFGERYKTDKSPEGRKVVYLQKNGFDHHQEHANKYFKKNDVLTVKEIYVGRSSSEVEFVEFPNQMFNTVLFADVKAGGYISHGVGRLAVLHNDFVLSKKDAEKFLDTTKIIEKLKSLDAQESKSDGITLKHNELGSLKQISDSLWREMKKEIERNGYSDLTLNMEGAVHGIADIIKLNNINN